MALVDNSPRASPLRLLRRALRRTIAFQVWCVQVGSVSLLLLDAELPERPRESLDDGAHLRRRRARPARAVRPARHRRRARAGRARHPSRRRAPERGHPALAALEQGALHVEGGSTLEEALERVRRHIVFTTRTPLQAGNKSYPPDQFLDAYGSLARRLGVSDEVFIDLFAFPRRSGPGMSALAMRLSSRRNGVSSRHGELAAVSRPMFPVSRPRTCRSTTSRTAPPRHLPRRSDVVPAGPPPWRALAAGARPTRTSAPVRHVPNDELWRARTAARRRSPSRAARAEQDSCCGARTSSTSARAPSCSTPTRSPSASPAGSPVQAALAASSPTRPGAQLLAGPPRYQVLIAGKAQPRDTIGSGCSSSCSSCAT